MEKNVASVTFFFCIIIYFHKWRNMDGQPLTVILSGGRSPKSKDLWKKISPFAQLSRDDKKVSTTSRLSRDDRKGAATGTLSRDDRMNNKRSGSCYGSMATAGAATLEYQAIIYLTSLIAEALPDFSTRGSIFLDTGALNLAATVDFCIDTFFEVFT